MTKLQANVVDSIDAVNENQWDNVVAQSECGTIFQQSGWLRAIERALDRTPRHVVIRKNGNPVAVLPNFVSDIALPVDLPVDASAVGATQLSSVTPGFGGPLIMGKKDRVLGALRQTLERVHREGSVFHRMRILDSNHVQYAQTLRKWGYRPSLLYCRFALELDDYDRILADMDKERRKEIRDAKEIEYEVESEEIDRETMRSFHDEYLKTMSHVDGSPFPVAFFEQLGDHLADQIQIFTAYVEGAEAGQHLYLRDDNRDALHYFFAGVDEEYFRYSSPTLLHDHALRWGIENGYERFDFGSTNANYANGTFNYKQKFGAELEPIYEWEKGTAPIRWPVYRSARTLYRRHSDTLEK
ncbi:GNAT family N-acetyltransferase (plasmid) [Halorussus limi]|uniref:GNAT family N-acetyltransferase n=1 Tax=Halorussus limi TaxID=2938695 RepID=A0A8U0I0G0_9EURY|nr:GNAT family N-acetyltransferase [Halorussus limi]UPV76668.1 GNAT family N-acetyltransferase [Halorussus limi]